MKTLENNYNKNTKIPEISSPVSRAADPAHCMRSPGGRVGGSPLDIMCPVEMGDHDGRWDGSPDERGYLCKRRSNESWRVEEFICRIFSGDGRCDLGSEPEVRFVFHHVPDERQRGGKKGEFVLFHHLHESKSLFYTTAE